MRLYDTLTRKQRDFTPVGDKVKMYICGITPYAPSHMGHAMSYITFDALRRYLEFSGYQVEHVQNFTDIDDKIIKRAQEDGISTEELSKKYIADYFTDMNAINVLIAHHYPRATGEIPRIIESIEALIEKDKAYLSHADVYFRVGIAPSYGKLSRRTREGLLVGARVEANRGKDDPLDFALWKGAKPGEPSWSSPWGPGRPGWHIECTAMSLAYLGDTLDIHGGGQDLVFPHHENEIAQTEAITNKIPFVNHWVHHGLLHMGEDKMSKSLGNLVSIKEALKQHSSDALRLFFLGSHYRAPQTYTEEGVVAMERSAQRLRNALVQLSSVGEELDPEPYQQNFIKVMDADLNTPQAVATLHNLAHDINRGVESGKDVAAAQRMLLRLGGVLGLVFRGIASTDGKVVEPFIALLAKTREELRTAKQFALADSIRSSLSDLGITLEDTPQGTVWKYRD